MEVERGVEVSSELDENEADAGLDDSIEFMD